MAASISVTTKHLDDKILVEAQLGANPDIPAAIFLYENTGTDTLGDYFGVCALTDFKKFREFTGEPIPVFANKYVRYTIGRKFLPADSLAAPTVEKNMVDDAKKFRLEYLGMTVPVTRSYNL